MLAFARFACNNAKNVILNQTDEMAIFKAIVYM